MNELLTPIFPLNTPLFPHCQIPLQIFEQRYLDMVSRCMRSGTGFAVSLLTPGSETFEVMDHKKSSEHNFVPFFSLGTMADITDFGQRDNGLLAITITGDVRQELINIQRQEDGLWLAETRARPEQAMAKQYNISDLTPLLKQLLMINGLSNLEASIDFESNAQVINYLITLLPFGNNVKQTLLEMDNQQERFQQSIDLIQGLEVSQSNH